jgi:hypothetical protein
MNLLPLKTRRCPVCDEMVLSGGIPTPDEQRPGPRPKAAETRDRRPLVVGHCAHQWRVGAEEEAGE